MARNHHISVAIMTYNRPWHLKNCWRSVRMCMPNASILVMDDASDDPQQGTVLAELERDKATRVLRRVTATSNMHGNLYENMQRALAETQSNYLMYLQDDTQLVRPVDATDLAMLENFFAASECHAFVSPFFMKHRKRLTWARKLRPHKDSRLYVSASTLPVFHYFDNCIAHVARLRARDWFFGETEHKNIAQAAKMFTGMGLMVDPIGFFCPQVPTFRNRARKHSVVSRHADACTATPFRYTILTDKQIQALRNRPPEQLPIAEDWLHTEPKSAQRPFVYQDYKASLWLRLVYYSKRMLGKLPLF
jgi:glycosyltransferase involved in cell wall biosynthesis